MHSVVGKIAPALAGIALAVLYSLGPVKLSALGLGEMSIVVAFGVLPGKSAIRLYESHSSTLGAGNNGEFFLHE